RDHRRLGPALDLFSFNQSAPGSPFFHPRGTVIYNLLVDYVQGLNRRDGFQEVRTPQILDVDLWHRSGHWDNYRENMFLTEVDERQYAVKPMNCPSHCLIYRTDLRSYRDLPIRYADFGRLHRYERSGVITGLTRVRTFCQDDAHTFCTDEQVEAEVLLPVSTILEIYSTFGFEGIQIEVSTRPEKSIGSEELWERAENALMGALRSRGLEFQINEGDGAFYGPKIDFRILDALGRSWQLGTVQLDYQMPERLDLEYTASDGGTRRPVMLHRAMLGSVERFLGILIEHTGGAFPVWLAPVQAVVLPVSDRFMEYGREVANRLSDAGVRVELDERSEKLGYKIRDAQTKKVPYMLVVGGREQEAGTVSLRLREATEGGSADQGAVPIDELAARVSDRVASKSLDL
ncbi:MAG: threonine--tRNA ligase, partial [Acidobacteriota bacterium]|nr:threonine--tRNA ligase [Acidobacteriota bacterium]